MKRSEVIKYLKEFLTGYEGDFDEEVEDDAHVLLYHLESHFKMLPPINKEKSYKLLSNGVMTDKVCEWEKE